MLKNTTKAVTLDRIKLDFFVVEPKGSTNAHDFGVAEFEQDGFVVAFRPLLSKMDENIGAMILENPVYVSFLAGENENGDVEGVLFAHVPVDMITEEESEPWRASVPAFLEEESGMTDEGVPLYPLGLLSRSRHERKYPHNFYEESRSMLRELLNVPVTDEAERAIEELFNTIPTSWQLGSL